MTYFKYSATLIVVKCCTFIYMPTKKRRIGFIPGFDVLKIIDNISEERKLSNSKVVNLLVEEALYERGLINKLERKLSNKDFSNFIDKIGDLKDLLNENDIRLDELNKEFTQSNSNIMAFKIFIQFLHFKKMMNIFNEYD